VRFAVLDKFAALRDTPAGQLLRAVGFSASLTYPEDSPAFAPLSFATASEEPQAVPRQESKSGVEHVSSLDGHRPQQMQVLRRYLDVRSWDPEYARQGQESVLLPSIRHGWIISSIEAHRHSKPRRVRILPREGSLAGTKGQALNLRSTSERRC
jgi:hypothetical protein